MQVKCSECGFLAVWLLLEGRFAEASENFRKYGRLEAKQNDPDIVQAKCFIGKHDLVNDKCTRAASVVASGISPYASTVETITAERSCNGYISWMQGFHPKEHTEMLLSKEMLRAQKRHANISLAVAVSAVLVGATFTYHSATIGAEATMSGAKLQAEMRMKTTQMQIEAQKDMAAKAPPINITIQMPEDVSRKR